MLTKCIVTTNTLQVPYLFIILRISKNCCGDYSNLTTTHCLQKNLYILIFTYDQLWAYSHAVSKHSMCGI